MKQGLHLVEERIVVILLALRIPHAFLRVVLSEVKSGYTRHEF